MLNHEKVHFLIAAITTAAHDAGPHGAPSGPIYAQLMGDCTLDEYNTVLGFGEREELWSVSPSRELITLEPKGEKLAGEIARVLATA